MLMTQQREFFHGSMSRERTFVYALTSIVQTLQLSGLLKTQIVLCPTKALFEKFPTTQFFEANSILLKKDEVIEVKLKKKELAAPVEYGQKAGVTK